MPHFIGEPKFFQDCRPGDLVRVSHRGGNRFALAISGNASSIVDRVVILDESDGLPLIDWDGGEHVISYGRNYRIREGFTQDCLLPATRFQPGLISWKSSKGEVSINLMVGTGVRTAYVDLETGNVSSQRGGAGFNVARWSVWLMLPDGADPVKVFEAAGKVV